MTVTQGAFNKLLSNGIRNQFHKSYSLGFRVSREMVEDDLYGNIFNMKRITKKFKIKVHTLHRVYITEMGSGVELDGNIIRHLGATTYDIGQAKDLVKAINMLLKLSKPKKVVKRRRRVKK